MRPAHRGASGNTNPLPGMRDRSGQYEAAKSQHEKCASTADLLRGARAGHATKWNNYERAFWGGVDVKRLVFCAPSFPARLCLGFSRAATWPGQATRPLLVSPSTVRHPVHAPARITRYEAAPIWRHNTTH